MRAFDVWLFVDLILIADVTITAVATILLYGPYHFVTVFGVCIPGTGAVTCYSANPESLLAYALFMGLVSLKNPKAAIPAMLFAVPFGEFMFFLASLDPLKPFFVVAYFQPLFFLEWVLLLPLAALWLLHLGLKPKLSWVLVAWLIADFAVAPFWPYIHTSWWSVTGTVLNIGGECAAIWYTFGLGKGK